jgi:hypothetical protein
MFFGEHDVALKRIEKRFGFDDIFRTVRRPALPRQTSKCNGGAGAWLAHEQDAHRDRRHLLLLPKEMRLAYHFWRLEL